MSVLVVLVVLAAGFVHAVWNAMAKSLHDQYVSFALLNLGAAAMCWVALPFVGFPRHAAWGYMAASVVCHWTYESFLMGAYRRADFSRSYPIARGIAPLLVSLGGFLFAREHPGAAGLAGIVVVVVGVVSLALRGTSEMSGRHAVAWALATGAAIAVYTVVDGLGVRVAGDALRYGALLFAVQSTLWSLVVVGRRGWSWWPAPRLAATGLASGVLSIAGYVTILWAQQRAALGVVSALRETGVLWAALIGVVVFREGRLRRILGPALLICAGIALISVG